MDRIQRIKELRIEKISWELFFKDIEQLSGHDIVWDIMTSCKVANQYLEPKDTPLQVKIKVMDTIDYKIKKLLEE